MLSTQIDTLPGSNANKFYYKAENKGDVIHLELKNLSPNSDELELKKLSGAKHVIETHVEVDALKGTCTGCGYIKIRLNDTEDKEEIYQKFVNKGYIVNDHKTAPQKDTTFSRPIY